MFVQEQIELGRKVLKGVSRSFYLTIRILPRLMRDPVSLAYLLARASDTLADTEEVSVEVRVSCLGKFMSALRDKEQRSDLFAEIERDFIPLQTNLKERVLLEHLEDIFRWYDSEASWSWELIFQVLVPICDGQMKDLQRFVPSNGFVSLTADELEEYCYLVAGSVGEFWGRVGYEVDHRFSRFEQAKLDRLGVEYGKGLQLVNILRDVPKDFENGRCYLPLESVEDREQVVRVVGEWHQTARRYIDSGLEYVSSLRSKRVKVATVLPALIAIETLNMLHELSWEQLEAGVKVPRKVVWKCLWRAVWM